METTRAVLLGLGMLVGGVLSGGLALAAPQHSLMQAENGVVHRVVIQISQNDPAVMTTALNNAENLVKYFAQKGEKVEIEFVAYGPGLAMVRSDTSPVKDRLRALNGAMKNITFSGCNNTLSNQSKAENKSLSLVPEARLVPTGIGRIVELSEQGWTYVRP
jgi:intracellular sulfur oxidation DsrE/DsrF family protein